MATIHSAATSQAQIVLQPLAQADVARCVDIYFAAFQNPHSLACWPRGVPTVRQFWEDMLRTELDEVGAHWLKAVAIGPDPSLVDENVILAYAKWVQPKPGVFPETDLPTWPEGANVALCNETFGAWATFHHEYFGDRGHWYLEMVATAPEHQRRGAGTRLIQWGLAKADAQGWEAYLEASPEAKMLYEKLGFREVGCTETLIKGEVYRNEFMLRKPVKACP